MKEIVALVCGIEVEGDEGDPFPQCGSDHDVGRPPTGDPDEDRDEDPGDDEEGDPDDDEEGDSDDDEEGGSDDDEEGGSDDDED